ncbi:Cisd1 [Symbiodinium natans]|uniref:Cisd1 protein n=1 Tax=Symbiodinium natans TaxID=878477 RepID=A0A812JQ04_9DINO|nr:Cisd1 [Symbiodinium natans]
MCFLTPSSPVASAPRAEGGVTRPQPRFDANCGSFGFAVGAAGFLVLAGRQLRTARKAEGKINNKIDPEVPKVVTKEDLKAGDKKVYCRCWLSGTFPLCDGTHAKHNEATGDNVGPLIVSVKKSG